jgi:hypothetical protein
VVTHRELILPQLAATGVTAREVKKGCGFRVIFGPIRSADLPAFLQRDNQCVEAMREVTFTLSERSVLIPVELYLVAKPLVAALILGFLISGIGPSLFSLSAALARGSILLIASLFGIVGGAILTPLLLPWLPFRQFWLKGTLAGLIAATGMWILLEPRATLFEQVALMLWTVTISSYLGMNFTGSTPYTSLSGVDYEMRRAIPVQLGTAFLAILLWVGSSFL